MAGLNISNSNLLLTQYEKDVQDVLNQQAKSHKDPQQEEWHGLVKEGRIHTERSDALGFTDDGGSFPVASKQTYDTYQVNRRFFHAKIQLTGGIMAEAKKGPAVAKDAVESEVRGMLMGALKFYNMMYFGDGTGLLATVKGAGSLSGGRRADVPVDDALWLWEGAQVDEYNGSTFVATRTIDDVEQGLDASGYGLVNFKAPDFTPVSGYKLYWKDSYGKAITGLDALIDDTATTFQNVNVANVPRYSSLVLDNGGTLRPLTPQLLRQFMAGLFQKSGEKPGKLKLYASPWQAKEFEEMYEGDIRYSASDKGSGREVTSFSSALGQVELALDTDCPKSKLFAADLSNIVKGTKKPLGWRLQGGQIFLRSDQANVYTATMDEICEMFIRQRHSSGKIIDLSHDAVIAY